MLTVRDDSTNAIQHLVALVHQRQAYGCNCRSNFSAYLDDGISWTESNPSYIGDFRKVVAGEDAWVAIQITNTVSFSHDGENWITRSIQSR